MHRTRMVILFYCLSGIAAAFLSWATKSQLGEYTYVKGIDPSFAITKANIGDGWLTFLCFCVIAGISVTGRRNLIMNLKKVFWLVFFAFASFLISVYHIITILPLSKPNVEDTTAMKVSPGVGLYLTILVSLVLIILPFKYRAFAAKELLTAGNKKPLH